MATSTVLLSILIIVILFLDRYPVLKDHIQLKGTLSYPALQQEYGSASLLIDTSLMETYGMAVAEAIAFGVPVISLGKGNTKT